MTSFSLYLLGKKLTELNQTQESIETLSLWMLHHRKHAETIVKYWSDAFIKVSEEHKIAFLFLVNEIIKTTKRKSQSFREEFKKKLPRIFQHIGETSTKWMLIDQTHRILDIWRSHKVFEESVIDNFWACLNNTSSALPLEENNDDMEFDEPYNVKKMFLALKAPSPDELIEALESLQCYPSADKYIRNKIAAFPKKLFETKTIYSLNDTSEAADYAEELKKAGKMVENYNRHLEQEIKQRKKLHDMLLGYNEAEMERIASIEQKLNVVENDLDEKNNLRQALERHRESLPDLQHFAKIPELPPLPSAKDLFKKQKIN